MTKVCWTPAFLIRNYFQYFHRRIVTGNPADRTATMRARSAEKHIFMLGLYPPAAYLVFPFCEWKGRCILKNIAMVHSERILDIDRTLTFDAEIAISSHSQAIFQWLFQPLIDTDDELLLSIAAHVFVVFCKQGIRRIEPE